MKGKVIPLKPRTDNGKQGAGTTNKTEGFPTSQMREVERLLWRAASRVPGELRERVITVTETGERLCPALFLIIASLRQAESRQTYRLAASLEALHLALKTHRDIAAADEKTMTEAILCGDYYFGLALTLAGHQPLFVQGMSEVITRFGTSAINTAGRAALLQGQCKNYLQKICDGMASIYALSCALGAWQAGLKTWQNEVLSYYGLYLGIGLQIKCELENFSICLRDKQPLVKVSLPVFYIIRESPLRHKLISLLDRRLSEGERDLFLQEANRVNPRSYLDQVVGNCFSKANHFIELLRESVDHKTLLSLKKFIS